MARQAGYSGTKIKTSAMEGVRHRPEVGVLNSLMGAKKIKKVLLYNGTGTLEEAVLRPPREDTTHYRRHKHYSGLRV